MNKILNTMPFVVKMYRLLSIAAFLVPLLLMWGLGIVLIPGPAAIGVYILLSILLVIGTAMVIHVWKEGVKHDE